MSEFNLRALIAETLDHTDEPDPGVIAGQVLAKISSADQPAALSQAMRTFVRQVISERRNSIRPGVRSIGSAPSAPLSLKGSLIRDGWQRRLNDRIEGADGWVMRGQATYEDLIHAAEFRETQARKNNAVARDLRNQASAVLEAGVATLGELSAETLMRVLGGAA